MVSIPSHRQLLGFAGGALFLFGFDVESAGDATSADFVVVILFG